MSETPSGGSEQQRYACENCGNVVEAATTPSSACPTCGQTAWAPEPGRPGTHEAPVDSI